jgi:predicted phage-related endonuclease
MRLLEVVQGTPDWHVARGTTHRTGSVAPAMMGVSLRVKRTDLLHMTATGSEQEFSDWFRKNVLEHGHAVERLARPIAEEILGEALYPATVTDDDGYLLASLDGLIMDGRITWECKQYNRELFAAVQAGECPPYHRWQVAQGLHITSAEKCLFMCSDGTRENTVWCWVSLREGEAAELLAGWKQFDVDLAAYTPPEIVLEPTGTSIQQLPALLITVEGRVLTSNLAAFRDAAHDLIASIRTDLQNDQDFADARKAVVWCKDGEDRLEVVKGQALSQTSSIDELFRTVDEIRSDLRDKRLSLERLIKARNDQIRFVIVQKGKQAFAEHVIQMNDRLAKVAAGWWPKGAAGPKLATIEEDFAGSIRSLKSIASMHDRVSTHLAHQTIKVDRAADAIQANIGTLRELAPEHAFLFTDAAQLVLKANSDLVLVIESRMTAHRERVRQEELERDRAAAAKQAAADAIQVAATAVASPPPAIESVTNTGAPGVGATLPSGAVLHSGAVATVDWTNVSLCAINIQRPRGPLVAFLDDTHLIVEFSRAPSDEEVLGIVRTGQLRIA